MPDPLGDFSYVWPFYAAPLVGYLLGSVPFGLIFTRLAGQGDIRALGSGNIGATNVLRTTNKTLALLTLLFDAAKGGVPVALTQLYLTQDFAVLVGGGALVGHIFPGWLRFRGGKGVATGLGILLGLGWPVGLTVCAIWLAVAVATRYASVAALAAFAAAPVCAWVFRRSATRGVRRRARRAHIRAPRWQHARSVARRGNPHQPGPAPTSFRG